MKLIDWLRRATTGNDGPAPEIANAPPELPDEDAAETTAPEMARDTDGGIHLDDLFAAIEYRDSTGRLSRRRITMLRLVPESGGASLHAICHERRAFRRFRADRIICFIDADGVIIDPPEFWRSIGIDPAAFASGLPTPTGQILRDTFRPALSVLVALSRCDGDVHPGETAAILSYIDDAACDLGLACDDTALAELGTLIARMRPRQANIEGHYLDVMSMEGRYRNRFARAVKEVILADGKISPEESAMAEEMEVWANR